MLKHLLRKHLKKKHHPKKSGHEAPVQKPEEPMPRFVIFGLEAVGVLAVLIPTILIVWAVGAFEVKYSERFYPGVFIGGEPVGGQTYTETLNYFKGKAEALEKNGLTMTFESSKGKREVSIPMSAAGLTADNSVEYFSLDDWENTLEEAYRWGHGANIFRSSKEQLALLFGKKNFVFPASVQKEAVKSLLDNELHNFFKASVPAGFSSAGNKISISKEKSGENINKEEVMNVLESKLSKFDATPTIFKTYEDIPEVTAKDLEPFLGFAENLAKKTSLVFQYRGHKWKIKGPKLVTWLTVKKEGRIGIDRARLEDYLENTVSKFIDNPPKDSRFEMRKGKLFEVIPGKSGNVADIDKAIEKIELKDGAINVPIETTEVEPKVTRETVEKYQIKDLVGAVRTSFAGSTADREHNIKIGVAAITGMLIAPGAEFSTVASIGPVTEKEGYLKELVIKENSTAKEFGGGLCQVATTLFRLALNAGLPITERQNHRFVVHYYGAGLDATIYGPHPDFRFVNDTGNYLLLQARVENKQVIMELYGQKDGRTAEVSEPVLSNKIPAPETKYVPSAELSIGETKCSETPHDGITADALYTVNYPDGTIKKRNFKSVYQPWQKICLVGTAPPKVTEIINQI